MGAGLTDRALVPNRSKDAFGVGMALGWLDPNHYSVLAGAGQRISVRIQANNTPVPYQFSEEQTCSFKSTGFSNQILSHLF